MTAADTVLAGLDDIRPHLEEFYKDLHANPELGLAEHRTAARVAERLRESGYDVIDGIGGTGVVGVLSNGDGPTVLLRADMDALPVKEDTGLPYASTATTTDEDGRQQPLMHACGHDVHMTCMLGFAHLMAQAKDVWQGTLVPLFQPSEENSAGADAMVRDDLAGRIPRPDVAFAQHVLPYPAGYVGVRPGPFFAAADSLRVTLYGRGGHGSMPQATVDPVVMAAMCVLRLQTIVSRELPPTTPAVVTVGSVQAGASSNVIPATAVILVNIRTYDEDTRRQVLDAVRRCVNAEAAASGAPREPEIERFNVFPPTLNDADVTGRLAPAFKARFGDDFHTIEMLTASEDFSLIPDAFDAPFAYWGIGGIDPGLYAKAVDNGTVHQDVPVNHSPRFAPVVQPTLDTGIAALTVAALEWLG
ncbi:amidohydrolase [Actinomadura soli]|uniref:Amidohydrolase n=1 Tax=Actinomadura soli TaxID=2508997 RepID=A0A5C4JCA8_9ACTN|nr:amidohydrolase [Actinomadura soli]TMR00490.1 amidohydrolase [Actinomadura soli]